MEVCSEVNFNGRLLSCTGLDIHSTRFHLRAQRSRAVGRPEGAGQITREGRPSSTSSSPRPPGRRSAQVPRRAETVIDARVSAAVDGGNSNQVVQCGMSIVGKRGILIVRSTLAMLAILPMLLPSGMCWCQFACETESLSPSGFENSSLPSEATWVATSAPEVGACKRCCRRNATSAGESNAPTTTQPSAVSPPPHYCDPTPPQDPQSDCPVLTGLSPRLAVVTDSIASVFIVAEAGPVEFVVPVATTWYVSADVDTSTPATAPLFISHCALLI